MEALISFDALSTNELVVLALLVVWSLAWKGVALWRAGRNGDKWWFIVMLILNTVGIFEIIYIFGFSKEKDEKINVVE